MAGSSNAVKGWGAPRPYSQRRRRMRSYGAVPSPLDETGREIEPPTSPTEQPATDDWGVIADVVWVMAAALLVLGLIAAIAAAGP